MVFSSYIFLFWFLPLTLAAYYLAPPRARNVLLTVASYIFYGWANPWFVLLMAFTTWTDYAAGQLMSGRWLLRSPTPEQRRLVLIISVIINLGMLGFFKYLGFAQASLNYLLEAFGYDTVRVFAIVLPVGISFYTFQSLSYTIDLYRGEVEPAQSLLDFACYVSLFPQLVAGPIVRYADIAAQLIQREHTVTRFAGGLFFLACGLAKKILLANPAGEVADVAFGADGLFWYQAWIGAFAFTFQIYFDFSGYSDMAIGLGHMLGFDFRRNFNRPLIAATFTEFWQRWHISLSTWLRDYLYIPLGGNRKGPVRTYINLFTVMLLGGLWHGAGWTFVVWGAVHGVFLATERLVGKRSVVPSDRRWVQRLGFWPPMLFTFIIFRADTIQQGWRYTLDTLGLGGGGSKMLDAMLLSPDHILLMSLAALFAWALPDTWDVAEPFDWRHTVAAVVLLVVATAVMLTQSYNPFLYFRF